MSGATGTAFIDAIKARLETLRTARATNPPAFAARGLVSLATVIDALARRHLHEARLDGALSAIITAITAGIESGGLRAEFTAPEVGRTGEIEDAALHGEYVGYCQRFTELSEAAQYAVRDGALLLRSGDTGAPLRSGEQLSAWLSADLLAELRRARLDEECATWSSLDPRWPDAIGRPPGALLIADAEAWATSNGFTRVGELLALLGISPESPPPREAAPVLSLVRDAGPAPATAPGWTPERLAKRQTELKGQGVRNHTQRLAAESGIEEREIRRQIENWRKSGPLGAIASQLSK